MRSLKTLTPGLLEAYGPQGWWPIHGVPEETDGEGYHRGNYSLPRTGGQRFEIVMGAVLTQNTGWRNVRIALDRLLASGLSSPGAILEAPINELREAVKSSGYFNQKSKKLKAISRFFHDRCNLENGVPPSRDELLNIWGVGEETADSILLYAFKQSVFVVDAYSKRIFERLGIIGRGAGYGEIQAAVMGSLTPDSELYNEAHALLVRHAKEHCRKAPLCGGCPLQRECLYPGQSPRSLRTE